VLLLLVLALFGDHGPGRHDLGSGPSPVVPLRA
jgi:hypothetical protein